MLQLLGLAARARKISTGETALASIRSKQAKLVLIASDASANTQKKYIDKCTFYEVPYSFIESSVMLSRAIGQNNRMVVAILDEGFATKLSSYLKG